MKEVKHLRLRSLAAFLVPLLFAVWMMQPAPLRTFLPGEERPAVFSHHQTAVDPRALAPEADLSGLLEGRWCVKVNPPELAGQDYLTLRYETATLYLLHNAQYLLLEDGRSFQLPGKALLPQVTALLAAA